MPRTNLCKDRNTEKDKNILKLISAGLIDQGMKKQDFIKKSGIPSSTVYGDLKEPKAIPVHRLRTYFDVLHIPETEREGVL